MRRGEWAKDIERLRAASQEGVISALELERLGVPECTTYRRCAEEGPWNLVLPGTILLTNGDPTDRQRLIAALVHAGEGAVLTGVSAARLHGLRRLPATDVVHVLIPNARQVRSAGFAVIERTTRLPVALERDGLPVAPIARCVLDQARRMKDRTAIAALLTEPVQRRLVLDQTLTTELESGSRRGTAAVRRVLRAVRAGVRSAAEFECREWWLAQPGLPEAEWNVPVHDEHGRFIAVVDCLVRAVGFVWEIDSVEEHFATPEQVADTARRRRRLRAVGLHVESTRPTQRRDDPRGVLEDIVNGLEIAGALPEPRVVYGPPRACAS